MQGIFSPRRLFPIILCLTAGSPNLHASAGTEGASFLDIPVGAGPAAMGTAYTALATDAYAPTSNPAGLGFLKGTELAGQHLSYIQSIRYEHFGFVTPLGHDPSTHRGIGVSIQDLGTGDIPKTDVQNGVPVTGLGSFSSHWGAYNLSYGQTVTDRLALGVTGKLIHASIDGVSASAYAFDAGSLYRCNERLSLAATVVNAGTKLTFLSAGDSLPMAAHLGGAYRLGRRWLFTAEGVYPKTGMGSFHAGTQWSPMDAIALRLGYKTDTLKGLNALAGLSTGIGIQAWGQELAYAWLPYGELGSAQYLSLVLRFGATPESRKNLIQLPAQREPRVAMADKQLIEEMERQR
jgi:hypothetical protein